MCGPALQRRVAFERELPLTILIVVASRAVFFENGSYMARVIRRRLAFVPVGRRLGDNECKEHEHWLELEVPSSHGNTLVRALSPPL